MTNPTEADAIVEQITACCADPAYDGNTMGVISLLGSEQAELIKTRLLERIGPEEMERRNLVCGDAYAFQGDERHVIFLSMVSAPSDTRRLTALTAASHERRFNVAASRAQDQMWLFHSVTKNDLSTQCLRYRLLEYAENPQIAPLTIEGLNVEKLKIDLMCNS